MIECYKCKGKAPMQYFKVDNQGNIFQVIYKCECGTGFVIREELCGSDIWKTALKDCDSSNLHPYPTR